ncbi:uncharacterized protein LOC110892309 [Helianthus annuus]|uniref:uncharacterized protein LOC110892309 n=1 Tax=Helianthus annuus TaxID=4232 RepID=UPI000B8FD2C5|nr:uncharacterized protein LOC110892309 [Helianthus annuus]
MSGTSGQNQIIIQKEGSSLSQFQCPILKPTNYTVWAIRIKTILEANGLWETIEPAENATVDIKKDKSAIAYLFQAIPEDVVLQVASCKTAKEIWDNLKVRHVGVDRVQKARMHTLLSEFELLQMKDDDTIDSFTAKINSIVTRATEVGTTLSQPTLVRKLLNGVLGKFTQIVASMEQYSDLETMTLEEAVGKLKTYEERLKLKKKESPVNNLEELLYAGHGQHVGNHGRGRFRPSRGRGRGNYQHRGEGHTSYESEGTDKPQSDDSKQETPTMRDKSKITCYRSEKLGHYAYECPTKKTKESETLLVEIEEDDDEPALLMCLDAEEK